MFQARKRLVFILVNLNTKYLFKLIRWKHVEALNSIYSKYLGMCGMQFVETTVATGDAFQLNNNGANNALAAAVRISQCIKHLYLVYILFQLL